MAKTKKKIGAEAHSDQSMDRSLAGSFHRPIRVAFLGAGSFFTPRLLTDILMIPDTLGGEIFLVDIDAKRLALSLKLAKKVVAQLGAKKWKVSASTNRRDGLKWCDYVVSCIEVSGVECVRFDNDIPAKYGVDQCIGDTIGPGGLFKGLRTIPVWLEVLRDVERYCPEAIVLNYTNPMSMMCLAAGRVSPVAHIGLCHSVQGTSHLLAKRAEVEYDEMEWECAGINHLAWFTKLKHGGKDLYPVLKKLARADLARAKKEGPDHPDALLEAKPEWHSDLVRKDMMLQFGAFITESSGHLSEYLPYYRKRGDLMEQYCRSRYDGETGFYAREWPNWRVEQDGKKLAMSKGKEPLPEGRSWEYGSWIIEAREKDAPFRVHGNVMNASGAGNDPVISNLPADGCVEVACLIDRNGIQPIRFGELPRQMAAVCRSNMNVFDLGAQAAIEKSKEMAIHALMVDPLTSAVCSPAEIRKMTLEMFKAEADFLPGYK